MEASPPDAYFVRTGPTTYAATEHTGGAWALDEQHVSPLLGLVVHAIELACPDDGLALSRVSFDILGVVGIEEVEILVRTLRPGRTIELLEAEVSWRGRSVVLARAWRLAETDTATVAGGEPGLALAPEDLSSWPMGDVWDGGYIASLDVRRAGDPRPGRGTAWLATPLSLVAGEQVSALARFIGLVDTANGICVREQPEQWHFPNVDLTVHLHRQPRGPWLGLDTTVTFGPTGHGLTASVLHDEHGAVGTAAQSLTVRARS